MSRNLFEKKEFWEKIYETKALNETGWYQAVPETSLDFIKYAQLSKDAKIIDVGGGDSLLVDHLLEAGFKNLTVLDVSERSLFRAKDRLGHMASKVTWICSDIREFNPVEIYDLWHDRACLHFLTEKNDVELYRQNMIKSIPIGGHAIIATFSKTGPKKCSGIPIHQYANSELTGIFSNDFELQKSIDKIHFTPSQVGQNYVFCHFKRKQSINI